MAIVFVPEENIKWKDLNRCPYAWGTSQCAYWSRRDDERLFLIALDRYADKLQRKNEDDSTRLSDS